MSTCRPWWQQGVIYQLLVPSFLDTNGDGQGDLAGVLDRLDYLHWLGVKTIWLSPFYPSPMAELGYDVTDYTGVNPLFGSLELFDKLLAEAKARDLRIILDWVANHTSDQHPWFAQSRSSRDNPKRDWYIWRDAKPDGSPPNNWISVFGGSVWQWDERTKQYYCHTFLDRQPDLNWRNADVQAAMLDAMRFWLDRGVDGFRLDAACLMIKDDQLRDNPPNPAYREDEDGPDMELLAQYTRDQPAVHEVVAMMRRAIDDYGDRLLAGEIYQPIEKLITYYGRDEPELHLPLNLRLAWTHWEAEKVGGVLEESFHHLGQEHWPSWTISTHDCLRVAFRAGGAQVRVAAMLLMTLRGTPTLYYGEEVGMKGVHIPAEHARDPQGRRTGRNRDPERTPMQWDGSPNAGFTTGKPWLPLGEDRDSANVAVQSQDQHSLLALYRRLIQLRSDDPALVCGGLEMVSHQNPLLAFRRTSDQRQLLVVLNMRSNPQSYSISQMGTGRIVLSTGLDRQDEEVREAIQLRGDEGVIVALARGQRQSK